MDGWREKWVGTADAWKYMDIISIDNDVHVSNILSTICSLFTTNNKNVRKISLHQIVLLYLLKTIGSTERDICTSPNAHCPCSAHVFYRTLNASLNYPSEKIKKWRNKNYRKLVRSVTWIKWNFHGINATHWLLWSVLPNKNHTNTHSQIVGLKMKPTLREPDELRKKMQFFGRTKQIAFHEFTCSAVAYAQFRNWCMKSIFFFSCWDWLCLVRRRRLWIK